MLLVETGGQNRHVYIHISVQWQSYSSSFKLVEAAVTSCPQYCILTIHKSLKSNVKLWCYEC